MIATAGAGVSVLVVVMIVVGGKVLLLSAPGLEFRVGTCRSSDLEAEEIEHERAGGERRKEREK
jgi:hypothetical protein